MSVILIYGDSNSHGTMPMSVAGLSERHPKGTRWPDTLAVELGTGHEVICEGLPGRTTVHDDAVEGGERNGIKVLPAILHSHKPIDLMILMLGTNDLKHRFSVTAYEIARSIERLVQATRAEGVVQDIMIVAPAPVRECGTLVDVFAGAEARQQGVEAHLQAVAARQNCGFVRAGDTVTVSPKDGVHWDPADHVAFGKAFAPVVSARLADL
ncbi:SGNH/GDSL hydrolase family protein [Mesobacterium sp. TK19101]|uniref:SGNH/GDSL hydrolase family protein n=1 Tax=Mesobacterium hydrothermale TaxID=3111907 RepID=A0ABU6HF30_9RHOB|nr:SGNH/GDSL hydrolase family protein [Mesobacterium sp. TK19101]MEC3860586.1 SGNH/GDSL hydrolase family protein [Mesobacterium sp. TK19101]